jgi:hypothetical protein
VVRVLAYLALMLVTIGSMMFGPAWLMQPDHKPAPATHAVASDQRKQPTKPVPYVASQQGASEKTANAQPITPPTGASPVTASTTPVETAAKKAETEEPEVAKPDQVEGIASGAAGPTACDIGACSTAYQTFRASDCSYQPYEGPRRLCTKSKRTAGADQSSSVDAKAQHDCNIAACSAAYRSFDLTTCTYQPNYGPRRPCTK